MNMTVQVGRAQWQLSEVLGFWSRHSMSVELGDT